jgi:deoxyribonuclease-4
MSIAGGVDLAVGRGESVGCEAIQIFLKGNMQWQGRELTKAEIARFRTASAASPISHVFAHSCYLVNLAATNPAFRTKSIAAIIDEIERATLLGVLFIVMHPGAHMGAGQNAGLQAIAESLDEVFSATKTSPVKIALETTAGQGSSLGHRFEEIGELFQRVKRPERLGVCIDTCHIFAAGYDIRTPKTYAQTIRAFDGTIGCEQVVAFHLNDSKKPLGSRVDRHDHIGNGLLGLTAFRNVLRDPRWKGLPMVLETAKSEDMHEDVENLRLLRSLL